MTLSDFDINSVSGDIISRAVVILRSGEPVAIPTETVYGLAADAYQSHAVARIFEIKERPLFDPLIVHILDETWLPELATDVPAAARRLIQRFWPGPLTLILPKTERVPDLVTSGLPFVGIRSPRHPVARRILAELGRPLAAPSANRFGRISPTTAQAVEEELGNRVALIVDGGSCEVGLESTIISFAQEQPQLMRAGGISREAIEAEIGPVTRAMGVLEKPEAPGHLLHHYAPQKPLRLVDQWPDLPSSEQIKRAILFWGSAPQHQFRFTRNLSKDCREAEAAGHFFQMLRELDATDAEEIIAVRLPEKGLGVAINERLSRAAAKRS